MHNDQLSQGVVRNGMYCNYELKLLNIRDNIEEKSDPQFRKSWKVEKPGFKISRLVALRFLKYRKNRYFMLSSLYTGVAEKINDIVASSFQTIIDQLFE
jgi:hypothetical protein